MSYQNFKGDFPIVEKFFREDTDGGRVQIAVPEHVSITYFTDPQIGTFVAERNGEHCVNCRIVDEPDGTQYLLVGLQLSKCFLGEGELMAVVSEYVNDDLYSGGVRATPIPKRCGIVLYPGASDNSDSVVSSTVLSILGSSVTRLTYASMVSLRDNSRLTSGQFYRITDYITTTTQANTQSAGHPFDVIVLALNESTLSERAWAIQSERDADGYFSNSKLEAWQIWYCLDNDTSRFAWADSVNGKGVIYRMIDEWNNDCPYDFKNILSRDYHDASDEHYYYTFTRDTTNDYSHYGRHCNGNTIKSKTINGGIQHLNRCFFKNISGDSCAGNLLEEECVYNTFKTNCSNNRLGRNSQRNTFGNGFNNNTVNGHDNTFGNNCYGNVVEGMSNSTFGNSCYQNIVENNCDNIVLTANCTYNYFGKSCTNITLGTFFRNMKFGNFVDRISFVNDETASKNMQVQAYVIDTNINQSGARLKLNVTRALNYTTQVAKDSAGNVKQFCIADIFDAIEQITIKEE